MLAQKPAAERSTPPSLRIDGKNEYFSELRNPSYIGAERDAERDLAACAASGFIEIIYRDKKEFLPLGKRKASVNFNIDREEECREALGLQLSDAVREWSDAVRTSNIPNNAKEALLLTGPIRLPAHSASKIVTSIATFIQKNHGEIFVRQASSAIFWGHSKVLDNRPNLWPVLGAVPAPVQIVVHAHADPLSPFLFIENRQSFEAAQQNKKVFGSFTLVYLAGFAGTASRLQMPQGRSLYFSSDGSHSQEHTEVVAACLEGRGTTDVFFWGDLDYAGISIYQAFKRLVPSAKLWQQGYEQMIIQLKNGNGHDAAEARKSGQEDPVETGDDYIDGTLLPMMREHGFFDQEGVII